jgi:hypothetical protein
MVVLCSLLQYFSDHLQDLTRTTNDFLESSFNTLVTFLRTSQSQSFLGVFFATLPEIIEDFKLPLFKHTNTLCGELTYPCITPYFGVLSPSLDAFSNK